MADLMGTVLNVAPALQVLLDGADTPAPAQSLGSYSPVMGDRVKVDKNGRRLLILGLVGPPALEIACGTVAITPSAANTPTPAVITFPDGRFTAPPKVTATAQTGSPTFVSVSVLSITATGVTIWLTRINTVLTTVEWQAVNIPADN